MSETKKLAHSLEDKTRTRDVIAEGNVSFESLVLPGNVLKGLIDNGFHKASPIQIKAIPLGKCGFDLLVKSKSGTGKTLVFTIVALDTIDFAKIGPQILVVTPTREIAVQIRDVFKAVGCYFDGLNVEYFIGGFPIEQDKLKCRSCHVAIGTPGRLKQLIQTGILNVSFIRLFVLDEADKLMENSFENDVNEIYNSLPAKKQVIMCSATYTKELETLLTNYMLSPTYVSAEIETPLLLGLKQFVRITKFANNIVQQTKVKNDDLVKIFAVTSFTQCLVFSNYQSRAESTSNFLNRNGWSSTYISGAQNQNDRLNAISNLKDFKFRILISTDLTARGIDAANVDLVINYDIPTDAMTYLHRMGRAGRYGSTGVCINMASEGQEVVLLQNILGSIGGTNLSIPILNDSFNLKEENLSKENLLSGVVSEKNVSFDQFKVELDKIKVKPDKSRKIKHKKDDLDKVKGNVEESIADVEATSILGQLAEGNFELGNNGSSDDLNCKINSFELLSHLTSDAFNIPSNQEHKLMSEDIDITKILTELAEKGKTVLNSNLDINYIPSNPNSESDIYKKNRTLFSVAKTLSNCDTDQDDIQAIGQYLNSRRYEDYLQECNVLASEIRQQRCSQKQVLENIFSMAYQFAINPSTVHWQNLLPEEERMKIVNGQVEDDCQDDIVTDEFGEEYNDNDEEYNFELEKEIEVNYDMQPIDDFNCLKWVPVEAKSQKSNEYMSVAKNNFINNEVRESGNHSIAPSYIEKYCNQYGEYFRHCSEHLWQTGLSFNTVEQFDQWFCYDWQAQVSAVRNCIQQKIYVEEMAGIQRQSAERMEKSDQQI